MAARFAKAAAEDGHGHAGLCGTAWESHPEPAAPQDTAWPWAGRAGGLQLVGCCWRQPKDSSDTCAGRNRERTPPSQQLPKTELELPLAASWREVWQQMHHGEIKAEWRWRILLQRGVQGRKEGYSQPVFVSSAARGNQKGGNMGC